MAARIGWIGRNIATSVASQCWCPQEPMAWYPWAASNERDFFFSVSISGWWFGTFFIFHNIWDNPSHWLIFFKMVKTTNQIYNYRTVNKISDSTTLNILNCALALILYCQYDRYDVWLHLCAHFSRCSTPWCLTFRLMRRRRCHRCPPFESSFPQEIWYLLCRLCHQKDLLVDGDFLHRFPVFLSLKVGVNCWAEPPEMRRGCFSAKALPSNPLNVLLATSGTSWDSICWILWFVCPGQNVQIPNQQPIGIDQLWLLLVMAFCSPISTIPFSRFAAEVPRDVDERVQELHRRLEGSAEEKIARHVTGVPQVNPQNSFLWEVRDQFHRKFSEWICGYFPKKFVTPPCEVPRKVMERLHLRPESVKSVKSQNHNSGGGGRKSFASE